MITLTIVILEATYPIISPRTEILDIGNIENGYFKEGNLSFITQTYTFSVQPPILPFACSYFEIQEDVPWIFSTRKVSGIKVLKQRSRIVFCPNSTDFSNRIIPITFKSTYNFNIYRSNENLSVFYSKNEEDNITRIHPIFFQNNMEFPVILEDFSVYISKETLLSPNMLLLNFIYNDPSLTNCRLNQFLLC